MPLDSQHTNHVSNNNFQLYRIKDEFKVNKPYEVRPGLALSIWQDKYSRRVCSLCRQTLRVESHIGNNKLFCATHGEINGDDVSYQTWEERLREVVLGNFLLSPNPDLEEFKETLDLAVRGLIPFSGRHLQHGDANQPYKIQELVSNCSSAPFSFLTFLKLLCGSGVSSDYSSRIRVVNWDLMPNIRLVLDGGVDDYGDINKGAHADFAQAHYEFKGAFESLRDARHKYPSDSEWVRWFNVKDSREGWAEIISALETAAYHEKHKDKLFIFDFSNVRASGMPIMGMQGRPASGPLPLMRALLKVASIKGAYMVPWKQALFIDDYLSSCVSIGGARRSARLAAKWWEDRDIFDFIEIKRGGHLRMANNSILVNKKFWQEVKDPRTHAYRVFHAACGAAYYDNTGEPGFINVDNIRQNRQGIENITIDNYIDVAACGMVLHPRTYDLIEKVLNRIKSGPYLITINPCSEAPLAVYGDDCLVGDISLHLINNIKEAQRSAYLLAKALVRAKSFMPGVYKGEGQRTNRIGVSSVGIFEFFWKMYGLDFFDMISVYDHVFNNASLNEECNCKQQTVMQAWYDFASVAYHAEKGAIEESRKFGLSLSDTVTLLKPGGTVAKVVSATESANLPVRSFYLRYIQYPKNNSTVEDYRRRGYPIIDISHKYDGYVAIGFPTEQPYVKMLKETNHPDECIAVANKVSMEDNYKWLRLLEKFWLEYGEPTNCMPRNGQIAFTLKYDPYKINYEQFTQVILQHQPTIRCCTYNICSSDGKVKEEVQELINNYGYVPEMPITWEEYQEITNKIEVAERELYDDRRNVCENGSCSVDENINR